MDDKKILVADDEPFMIQTFPMQLGLLGQKCDTSTDGSECLSKYQANHGAYKLIFMDLQMPKMDGFDAAKAIRAFEKSKGLARIKIIALSGDDDEETKQKALACGMDGILSKPIKVPQLKTLL